MVGADAARELVAAGLVPGEGDVVVALREQAARSWNRPDAGFFALTGLFGTHTYNILTPLKDRAMRYIIWRATHATRTTP